MIRGVLFTPSSPSDVSVVFFLYKYVNVGNILRFQPNSDAIQMQMPPAPERTWGLLDGWGSGPVFSWLWHHSSSPIIGIHSLAESSLPPSGVQMTIYGRQVKVKDELFVLLPAGVLQGGAIEVTLVGRLVFGILFPGLSFEGVNFTCIGSTFLITKDREHFIPNIQFIRKVKMLNYPEGAKVHWKLN